MDDQQRLQETQATEEEVAEREVDAVAVEEIIYAGFWLRLLAFLLDSVALYSLNIILRLIAGQTIDSPSFGFLFLELIYALVYYVGMTTAFGQTLGKMVFGIKVIRNVSHDNSVLGTMLYRELFGKFLSMITFGIGFLMIGWSRNHRGLHDLIADTSVIISVERGMNDERKSA